MSNIVETARGFGKNVEPFEKNTGGSPMRKEEVR